MVPQSPSVTVTWVASPNATNYIVYRTKLRKAAACPAYPLDPVSNMTTYTDTTVTAKNTYYYSVAAVNLVGSACSSYEMACFIKVKSPTYKCLQFKS